MLRSVESQNWFIVPRHYCSSSKTTQKKQAKIEQHGRPVPMLSIGRRVNWIKASLCLNYHPPTVRHWHCFQEFCENLSASKKGDGKTPEKVMRGDWVVFGQPPHNQRSKQENTCCREMFSTPTFSHGREALLEVHLRTQPTQRQSSPANNPTDKTRQGNTSRLVLGYIGTGAANEMRSSWPRQN